MADSENKRAHARSLRANMTFPERKFWGAVRNRRLANLKFRRQVPLLDFIVDYVCAEHHLVVEIDGKSHIGQYEYDCRRQQQIERMGYKVLRFGNDDILEDLDVVLSAILKACEMTC